MVFPDGTDWGGETVKLVVGIAGVGDEHLAILQHIAEQALEVGAIEKISKASSKEVYEMLKGGE
mgnify:CR=1 FL=1